MPEKKLIHNPEDIQLNNHNDIDQILGNPPSWVLRWGLVSLFFVALLLGGISWLVKYPDTISAKIIITTEKPAIRVFAQTSGKIKQLLVQNNEEVNLQQSVAIIESPAVWEDVETLKSFVTTLSDLKKDQEFLELKIEENLAVGTLQNSFARLSQKIKDYKNFLKQTGTFGKIKFTEEKIDYLSELNNNIKNQLETLKKEVLLRKSNLDRNEKLFETGAVSIADLETSKTQYLQYQRQIENFQNEIINNKITVANLKTQIIELNENRTEGHSQKRISISEDIQKLKNEIKQWEQTYILTAPIEGKISFSKTWNMQQFINTNEEVFTVVPERGSEKIIGKAILPIKNSGKVKQGQTANIELDGFPFQEFGILKSTVKTISLVPQDENYILEIDLNDSLKTTYNKTIPFRQEMHGTAKIITEDRRIIERVFDRFYDLLKNS